MSEVQTFIGMVFNGVEMPIIVVYDSPKDFPRQFVGRLFDGIRPTKWHVKGDCEEDIVGKIPRGFVRFARSPLDDRRIVCTYF